MRTLIDTNEYATDGTGHWFCSTGSAERKATAIIVCEAAFFLKL